MRVGRRGGAGGADRDRSPAARAGVIKAGGRAGGRGDRGAREARLPRRARRGAAALILVRCGRRAARRCAFEFEFPRGPGRRAPSASPRTRARGAAADLGRARFERRPRAGWLTRAARGTRALRSLLGFRARTVRCAADGSSRGGATCRRADVSSTMSPHRRRTTGDRRRPEALVLHRASTLQCREARRLGDLHSVIRVLLYFCNVAFPVAQTLLCSDPGTRHLSARVWVPFKIDSALPRTTAFPVGQLLKDAFPADGQPLSVLLAGANLPDSPDPVTIPSRAARWRLSHCADGPAWRLAAASRRGVDPPRIPPRELRARLSRP